MTWRPRRRYSGARYAYPLISCDNHPGPQFSLACCLHVATKAAPASVISEPTPSSMGQAICAGCVALPGPLKIHELALVCLACFDLHLRNHH